MMTRSFPILAASFLIAAPASAGFLVGNTDAMIVGAGYIDLEDPSWENLADAALIENPPVGSFISVASGIPGVETFLSYLRFDGLSGNTAVFVFENIAQAAPFSPGSPYEAAFAGNRLTITSSIDFVITLQGTLLGTGAGRGGFNLIGSGESPVIFDPAAGPVLYSRTISAGTRTFGWSALVGPLGGTADFVGTMTVTFIPAPAAVSLLAITGFVGGRRRRR